MSRLPILDSTVQKTHEWLKDICGGLGFDDEKAAYAALRATLHALRDRLPSEQAVHLGAQLPTLIRGLYYEGWDTTATALHIRHKQDFFELIHEGMKEHHELADVGRVARIVFGTLSREISPGQREKILKALPKEIRELWPPAEKKWEKMPVKAIMSTNVTWLSPDASLQEAAAAMRDKDIGCVPVGKEDRLVGMITDRDMACRAVAEGRDPKSTTVGEMMSSGIAYCFEDQDVTEAAQIMKEKQLHRLAVLDRHKRMVGILSLGDMARHIPHALTGEVIDAVSQPQ